MLFLLRELNESNGLAILTYFVLMTVAFIAAIAVHEGNHALIATALGDDTPRRYGRLSLNPFRHVDRTGLVVFVLAGIGWGWTPVNPQNLRPNPRTGNAIVASAGPLANLGLAILLSIPLRLDTPLPPIVHQFLYVAVALNLLLFAFNLIPIPPLDGFTVLVGLLPRDLAASVKRLEQYGFVLIMALLFIPALLHIDVVGVIFGPVSRIFGLPSLR